MATEDKSSQHELHSSDIDMESWVERRHKFVDPIQHEVKKSSYDVSSLIMMRKRKNESKLLDIENPSKKVCGMYIYIYRASNNNKKTFQCMRKSVIIHLIQYITPQSII